MIAEQVQTILIEPTRIVHMENVARKSYKIINWLKVISMHRDNQEYAHAQTIVRDQIHENFVMQEGFWQNEISLKFAKNALTNDDINFLMLALDDGPYFVAAGTIAKRVLKEFANENLKINFTLSVLEKMVNFFNYDRKNGSQFYKYLRTVYEKTGNTKKIRECFEREIKQAFDDFDMTYDEYKLWQKQASNLQKFKRIYQETKEKWEAECVAFDQLKISQLNVRRSLLELQYRSIIQQKQFAVWLQKLPAQSDKIWFLRRWVLNYRQMIPYYLMKCEQFYSSDQEKIITKYRVAIRLSESNPKIQEKYLCYLSRRISKHITSPEQLLEDYSNTWGQKVAFFRDEINNLITKERKIINPIDQEKIFNNYYKIWIQVEENIVKDKETVCKLYQNLIKNVKDQEKDGSQFYKNYAKSLMQLNAFKDAKNILKRYHYHAKNEQSKSSYQRFIGFFGTIDDEIQFSTQERNYLQKRIEAMSVSKTNQLTEQVKDLKNDKNVIVIETKPQKETTENERDGVIEAPKRQRNRQFDEVEQKIQNSIRKKLHIDGDSTVFMKGIPTNWTQSDVLSVLTSGNHVTSVRIVIKQGVQKDYCYIQFDNKQSAEEQVRNNKSGYTLNISRPPAEYDQSKTLFVCALPVTATLEKIASIFSINADHIIDIRLKLEKDKNYAYVEFDTKENKESAFSEAHRESMLIDGKKILVQHCDSNRQKNKKFAQVVFLKNLPYKASEKDIENFFKDMKLSNLMIPKDQKGKSKGFGYAEFQKFKDYQTALDMRKGELHGRQFQILKSDRQITMANPHKIDHHKVQTNESSKEQERPKQNSKQKQHQNRKKQKQKVTQNKDTETKTGNSYFSSLFG